MGGGGKATKTNFNTVCGWGYCKMHIHACMYTHMYAHACTCCLMFIHPCMHAHTHVCMHAYAHMHLHPDMKIIKIKASELYETKTYTIYL